MAIPKFERAWPGGLVNEDVPQPGELNQVDENAANAGNLARKLNASLMLAHLESLSATGALNWGDYDESFDTWVVGHEENGYANVTIGGVNLNAVYADHGGTGAVSGAGIAAVIPGLIAVKDSSSNATGLVFSTDGGYNYSLDSIDDRATNRVIVSDGLRILLIGDSDTMYTTDGTNWTTGVGTGYPAGYNVGGDVAHDGNGTFISCFGDATANPFAGPEVLSSDDGGATFITHDLVGANEKAQSVAYHEGTWFVGGGDDSALTPVLYTSTDRVTWNAVSMTLPSAIVSPLSIRSMGSLGPYLLAVFDQNSSSHDDPVLAVSEDGGATWELISFLSAIFNIVAAENRLLLWEKRGGSTYLVSRRITI